MLMLILLAVVIIVLIQVVPIDARLKWGLTFVVLLCLVVMLITQLAPGRL
jgi:hypothetical protein